MRTGAQKGHIFYFGVLPQTPKGSLASPTRKISTMVLEAVAAVASENDPLAENQSGGCVTGPPKVTKKKGESENKKRIKSQAFKADKLVKILIHEGAIDDVSDAAGLQKYIDECEHVSRSPHVDLWFDPPFD